MTPEEFADRFQQVRSGLIHFVMGLGADHDEAEDIAQECSLKLLRKIDQYKESEQFVAWARKCCRRAYTDRWRRRKRELLTDFNDEVHDKGEVSKDTCPYLFSGIHPSSFRLLERLFPSFKLFLERVSHCFHANVPDQFRTVLILMIELGISIEAAAVRLGLPAKETDNKLRYHFRKMRSELFDCICAGGIVPFS